MRLGFLTILLTIAGAGAVRADEAADCLGFGPLGEQPGVAIGRVVGQGRTHFVLNGSEKAGCPEAGPTCRAKGFLVTGDRIVVSRPRGAFVCADFVGPKGRVRAGWLPQADIVAEPAPEPGIADWLGTWTRDEAEIGIKGSGSGKLAIVGDATYGSADPDRVRRGAVNSGHIEGSVSPSGAALSFAMGTDATLPVEKGDSYDCKVWMRRLGPHLLVDDNGQCGGMNVSFRGIYAKRGR